MLNRVQGVYMDFTGKSNLGPTLGSDPESFHSRWCHVASVAAAEEQGVLREPWSKFLIGLWRHYTGCLFKGCYAWGQQICWGYGQAFYKLSGRHGA